MVDGDVVAEALAAFRACELSPDDPRAAAELAASAGRLTAAAVDALRPLLAGDDAVVRAGAAHLLGRIGQSDPGAGPEVRAALVAAARDEIDDSVITTMAAAVSAAGLTADEAAGLMQLGPALRRIGVYHLAMVASASPEHDAVRRALVAAGDDPDPQVRWWAAFGLDTSGQSSGDVRP